MKQITYSFIWIILVATMFVNKGMQAQNLAFEKLYCTTELDMRIYDFLLMPTSSVYVVGYDSANFAVTNGSAVIRKFDKDFNLLWEKKYGGSGGERFNLIQYIGDNRILVRGITTSQDGDVLNNYPVGNNEWVCILDTNGNILHQLIWGTGGQAWSIKLGPNGDIYFCGSTYSDAYDYVGNGPFDFALDGYISCTDSLLNKKWVHFFEVSPGDSWVGDVDFLPNGHLLLTCGSNENNGAFAVNTPTAKGFGILMEMDTLFNVYWQKRYGQATIAGGTLDNLYKDPTRWEYYVVGFADEKDGDCWDSYPYLAKGDHNYHWIMKIDTLGNKIWSHIYGPFSDDGLDGISGGYTIFDNNCLHISDLAFGSDNYDFGNQIGKYDTWLISIDSNGALYKHNRAGYPNVEWLPYLNKLNPITKEIYYLYADYKGGIHIPSPNVCDSTLLNTEQYIIGKYNYWPDGIAELDREKLELVVYPNPANDEISIEKLEKGTFIVIFTVEGKKVTSLNTKKPKETISVTGWQRGTYIIKASYKNQQFIQKIILQ